MRRIYHPWNLWECYPAGFFNTTPPDNYSHDDCINMYCEFLSDLNKFENALNKVIDQWKYSCEHFLTNPSMNKIAWLGQASACIELGLPSKYRSGFGLLTIQQQKKANKLADNYFKIWKKKLENTYNTGNCEDIQLIFPTIYLTN